MTSQVSGAAGSVSFPALGTTAFIAVTDEAAIRPALLVLRAELEAIDAAASRFRADSELVRLNAGAGRPRGVSPLLFDAIQAALRAARLTDGMVDPTVGEALEVIGYDRDFLEIDPDGPPVQVTARAVPGWQAVRTDPSIRTVHLPSGVSIDLGATAKALCADRAAGKAAAATGAGVLVSLGGDIAVRGPDPEGGWSIRVTHNHAEPPQIAEGPVVSIRDGGLSTSSTSVRRWVRGGVTMHHIIDPATGLPAREHWRTVSVAAGTCLDANIASCAAILLGECAPQWLEDRRLPARLVDPSGMVITVAGWPDEECGRAPDRVEEALC
jgi:thiamine biosynthesis lipoprotein